MPTNTADAHSSWRSGKIARSTPTIALGWWRHWPRSSGLFQPRDQLGEVAGSVAQVELLLEDPVPAIATCAGGAGQREQIGAARHAGQRARLDRGRADLWKAEHAEQLAKARDGFLDHIGKCFGRDVAAGHAGAAGRGHHLDLRIVD